MPTTTITTGVPHVGLKKLVGRLVKDFETNHVFQVKFHLFMMWFWVGAFVAGLIFMLLWPHAWVAAGVFIVYVISLYANWDTDFDAVSASYAALHAQRLMEKEGLTDVVADVSVDVHVK